jgi:hypothetical protein
VREAVAVDAAGQPLARAAIGIAPDGQPCPGEDQGRDDFDGPLLPLAPPPNAVAVAGPLLAADQGDTLCLGIGQLSPALCPPPPVDSDQPELLRRGAIVAGALSADAARVTLRRDHGPDVTVATTGYAGRWAGRVRFFSADVGAAAVVRATVRDRAGTIIGVSDKRLPPVAESHRVLAARGGQELRMTRRAGDEPCLTAFSSDLPAAPAYCTDLHPGTRIDGPYVPYDGAIAVACAPRQAIAYGRLPDEFPAPRVLLAGGRAVKTRRIALRGEDAFFAFLPDAPVRGLGAGSHRVALRLPAASAQCGYTAARSF